MSDAAITYVYAARADRFVKIGISIAPQRRVTVIKNEPKCPAVNGEAVTLIHATAGDLAYERLLHSALRRYRVSGEWYSSECLTAPEYVEFLSRPANYGPADTMLRFRCTSKLTKSVRYLAADDGTTEQAVLLRLLGDAVEREERKRKRQ